MFKILNTSDELGKEVLISSEIKLMLTFLPY